MKDQQIEAIELFQSWDEINVNEVVPSPDQKHLQLVGNKHEKLLGKKCELFHAVVAKLFYIMK